MSTVFDTAPTTDELARGYLTAKRVVVEDGFVDEIAWQIKVTQSETRLRDFVREAAWVVLSAGMRESVVRRVFGPLSDTLCYFDPEKLASRSDIARTAALKIFRHERKIDAIFEIAEVANRMGEKAIQDVLAHQPESFLCSLPYIGPVTWRHLAKNLGAPVAKADRHLVRIAQATHRTSVDTLCDEISTWLGEPVAVVDIVLWRWSVLHAANCRKGCESPFHN